MITKTHLQSIISKYYMEGLIDSTKWIIKDNQLIIDFISPNKNLVGKIVVDNFIFVDSELGIFDTTKLNKLIAITSKDIQLEAVKAGKKCTKLILSDNQFTVSYTLADTMLISKVPQVEEPEYEVEAMLENDDIVAMIKAKTALADVNTVSIQSYETIDGKAQLEFVFGNNDEYSNKISYYISQLTKNEATKNYKVSYDSELLKLIMNANKEISRGKLYLSLNGIIKLEFENNDIKSTYFLIQNESY
jgi:hypothetical protein